MKRIIIVIGVLIALIALALVAFRLYTKSFSPQDISAYNRNNLRIQVEYSRPYKNGRKVFGDLVPLGEVWRTGANEATTFATNEDLIIMGNRLKAGSYSLFTIPYKDKWEVIFNTETEQWGVDPFSGKANHNPQKDVLITEVPSIGTRNTFEQFTIYFDQMGDDIEMVIMWDQTLVVVPMQRDK